MLIDFIARVTKVGDHKLNYMLLNTDFSNIENILRNISDSLHILSNKSIFDDIIPFLYGLSSSIVGLLVGYLLTRTHEKRKFVQQNHIKFLITLNELTFEVNQLINDIKNIEKFGEVLLGKNFDRHKILPCKDFHLIVLRIKTFRAYLEYSKQVVIADDSNKIYIFNEINQITNKISDSNYFVKIMAKFEKSAMNYNFLITDGIRIKTNAILNDFSEACKENFLNYDISLLKKSLIELVKEVNQETLKNS